MKLEDKFSELKETKEGALMAHIYYGDPSEEFSQKLIGVLCSSGVDILEFGIPFTDPIADGPTFQAACTRALKNGITVEKCFAGIKKIREAGIAQPIVVTSYYNIIYNAGIENFVRRVKEAGAQAIIVPDAPFEESELLLKYGKKYDIRIILLITPRTGKKRIAKICPAANGFLYVVNLEGTTGSRENLELRIKNTVEAARAYTDSPLLAGFGISKPEQVQELLKCGADGVIIGSAIARIYAKNIENPQNTLAEIGKFCREIKNACAVAGGQSLLRKMVKYKIKHRGE